MSQQNASGNTFYAVHDQIPSTLNVSSSPTYNEDRTSVYTFSETLNSNFDLIDQLWVYMIYH